MNITGSPLWLSLPLFFSSRKTHSQSIILHMIIFALLQTKVDCLFSHHSIKFIRTVIKIIILFSSLSAKDQVQHFHIKNSYHKKVYIDYSRVILQSLICRQDNKHYKVNLSAAIRASPSCCIIMHLHSLECKWYTNQILVHAL